MRIGVPKEIKESEYRVAITPGGVYELASAGHEVSVEKGAGLGSGIMDEEFKKAGARLIDTHAEVFAGAELIMKVKEPLPEEYPLITEKHLIFTYFHFAAARELTDAMLKSGTACVAYETVTDARGGLPLLVPMSEVAGRMAIQEGAKYLEKPMMGRGILLGGVPGVERGHVTILGGGVVGSNAARMAAGLGADVVILDVDLNRLRRLEEIMPANVSLMHSNRFMIDEQIRRADLLVGAVLIPGTRAPLLVTRDHLSTMKPGAVIVDVAVDQGGCVETMKPTTHAKPVFLVSNVVHYGVANMPGAVGRTSTYALTNATLPYAMELAGRGLREAVRANSGLMAGLNIFHGKVTYRGVAEAFNLGYTAPQEALN